MLIHCFWHSDLLTNQQRNTTIAAYLEPLISLLHYYRTKAKAGLAATMAGRVATNAAAFLSCSGFKLAWHLTTPASHTSAIRHGLTGQHNSLLLLVTSACHLPRATGVARLAEAAKE